MRIMEFVSELDPNQLRTETIENFLYDKYTFFCPKLSQLLSKNML